MPVSALYSLMIVDDEEKIRMGLKNLIDWEDMGFFVACDFSDGKEAVAYIEKQSVDVILTDVKMTHVSGLKVAQTVNEKNLPTIVVLLSAYKEFDLVKKAINTKVYNYLLKPIKLDELYRVFEGIRKELDKSRNAYSKSDMESGDIDTLVDFFKQQFLRDIINGVIYDSDTINELTDKLSVHFYNDEYFLATIKIVNSKDLEYDDMISQLIMDLNELFSGDCSILNYMKDTLILFANIPKEYEKNKKQYCKQFAEKILSVNNGKDKPVIHLGISAQHKGYNQANGAFRECRCAIEAIDKDRLYSIFDRKSDSIPGNINRIDDDSYNLYQYIYEGNKNAVAQLTERIVNDIWTLDESDMVKKNYIIQIFSTIFSQTIKNMTDKNSVKMIDYGYILSGENPRAISGHLKTCFNSLVEQYNELNQNTKNTVVKNAIKYIQENFTNESINLSSIAETVYMSPSYFSRVFKECTNMNVTDYIIQLRIERAREFLRDTDLSIYDITAKIGYKSSKYFSKLFHRIAGMTPRAYRNSIRAVCNIADY